jgi:hypothetical protein
MEKIWKYKDLLQAMDVNILAFSGANLCREDFLGKCYQLLLAQRPTCSAIFTGLIDLLRIGRNIDLPQKPIVIDNYCFLIPGDFFGDIFFGSVLHSRLGTAHPGLLAG